MKDFRWPLGPKDPTQLDVAVRSVNSLYEDEDRVPMCYPGTTFVDLRMQALVQSVMHKNLNAIGTHTQNVEGEGGFDGLQSKEAQAVWMVASMFGGTPEEIDGNFCGGGTEANFQGIWIGRNWLSKLAKDAKKQGTVIFTTPLVHYSVFKAIDILYGTDHEWSGCPDCGEHHIFLNFNKNGSDIVLVPMNERGEMNVADLHTAFKEKYKEGYRRFMVVATVGTTLMGSVDPIDEINDWVQGTRMQKNDAYIYFHVDAAFAGFTLPFLEGHPEVGFDRNEHLMSIAVDADKMGHLPYPAGIVLCRKGMQRHIARGVGYVGGHKDDTFSGSRSSLSPLLAWFQYQALGQEGHRKYVQECITLRDDLQKMIEDRFGDDARINILPVSEWSAFLPLEIKIDGEKIPDEIKNGVLAPYHLRCDCFPQDPGDLDSCPRHVYKIVIMPHHTARHLKFFVDDLAEALKPSSVATAAST